MIVVCGEALIDLTSVERDGEQLWRAHRGGGPHNAAVALGRLGVPVAFLGRLSTDHFGAQLRAGLTASGVDLRFVVQGSEPTTLAVVTVDAGGSPSFTFYGEGTADRLLQPGDLPEDLGDAEALHFGTLSLVAEPQASTLQALMVREAGRRLLFCDPNVRPVLIGDRDAYLARLHGWLELLDVVKFSDADLEWLYPGRDPLALSRSIAADSGTVVVLTRGGAGADAFWPGQHDETRHVHVAADVVQVVDTVGAGDSFGAAFLAELRRHVPLRPGIGDTLEEGVATAALAFAARVAAITCSRAGADPPRADEL